ncbi:hypothetical protein GLOIN_2v1780924 [Rhizophagus irregularis DAOM 181602=DAOM 197198]|uniref:BED-type domain-containing protein n=1 Tax=Rhizophagus irregularis (strain DAOM 181602 / DAOM 197198 / MUCL 43194) TaxID=747089 RepID=A0A2P4PLB0_RHIID|nr:hypothetical protein GLOIN_2v1780924 [Rhizophagus irregularis DAOM 181602=DAOM 197198]POG66160.1 hypothetical protein GLOIN_2v1780924 [Rhizophagus irregularis DAOM 181602=DAOM 197198]|eukprot:XP_025173026.1 hypothetical protein GLOIN_2v1780924 [Rhizophagus irregularis DAOM 181602=DAOM 197198]
MTEPVKNFLPGDIVIFSDNEINNPKEKNSGYSFTDIWQYIKRGKSRGNDHYEATCSFCNKKWSRGKPASLRAHIANHCTATNISADVRSYFIQVVANENENKRKYYSSDNEAKSYQNAFKKQKIMKNKKNKASACPAKINNHFQKKEKLNKNPLIINLLKSLNANYNLPSHIRLTEILLETEVAKVNAKVDQIIERNEILL